MKSKGGLFCASHASTAALCSTADERRIVRRPSRSRTPAAALCSSKRIPFDPRISSHPNDDNNNNSSRNLLTDSNTLLDHVFSAAAGSKNFQPLVPYRPPENGNPASSPVKRRDQARPPSFARRPDVGRCSSSIVPSGLTDHQVVELRVSIHCKGCEGKVRKSLSKMEGVTSFSIDLESKKVTVMGNVTPLGVLANISKVKNAQLWPSSPPPPSSPPT